jgi:membrane protein implicated in regulation of membrane protease activity
MTLKNLILLSWLETLGTAELIYLSAGAVSSAYIVLRFTASLFGAELDHEFDIHIGEAELGDLSFSAFATLFALFGWSGFLGYRMTELSDFGIASVATASGLVGFFLAVFMLKKLKSLEQSGNLDLANAVGTIGEVYLTIPENDMGQIQIVIQGKLTTLNARTDGERIPTGEKVIVYEVEKGVLKVMPYQDKLNQ